nr:hypothetical protein [uncultured Carboxylicivirga sp.]
MTHKFKPLHYICFLSGVIIFIWLLNIAIAPYNKLKEIQNMTLEDSLFMSHFDSVLFQPELKSQVKEKAYKESLLKMSENDSIQLVVNLEDKTVNLSIKGIFIHQTKMSYLKTDQFWSSLSIAEEVRLFSKPLSVQSVYTTIIKEPVVIREAPKDTLEASANAWKPDTLIQNPAYVMLHTENNFRIVLEQEENENDFMNRVKLKFLNQIRVENLKKSVHRFFTFKKQEYVPTIVIKLPTEDIRSIYRALPSNTLITLKI